MAPQAGRRGGRAFRALLCALVAVGASLTTARSLEEPKWLQSAESSSYRGGLGRELKGVYQVEACAWIRGGSNSPLAGGFNSPSTGVCELHPLYGKLLLQNIHHPLKGVLFEEGLCFISGEEACESKSFCSWIPVSADILGRCIYKNAPQVSEECSSPGLESFASTLVECRDRRIDICTLQSECTVVGAENDMTRCGVVTSTVLDLLIGSEIKQVKLINALMEGAMYLNILKVPAYARAPGVQAAALGKRRLLQDDILDFNPTGLMGPPVGIDDTNGGPDDETLFGTRPSGNDGFGILPQDDKQSSLSGGGQRPNPPPPPASPAPEEPQAPAPAPSQDDDLEQKQPPKASKKPSPKSKSPKPVPSPPSVPAPPKGKASMTADTGLSAGGANATAQGPPSQPSAKKGGKQAPGVPQDGPQGPRQKGQSSITAMTKMSDNNATSPAAPSPNGAGSTKTSGPLARGRADGAPADQKTRARPAPAENTLPPEFGDDRANDTLPNPPTLVESVAQTEGSSGASGNVNGTGGSVAGSPSDGDGSLFAAGDDPGDRLTANGDAAPPPAAPSSGGRTSNTGVQPFAVDGDSIGTASAPSQLPNGPQYVFGAVIAEGNAGLGSGFTGKTDDGLGGGASKDGPESDEAKALGVVLEIVEGVAQLLELASSSRSGNETKLVLELAQNLENLRYRLDATYTKSSFSLWTKVDLWWWKGQYSLQDIKGASAERPNMAKTACSMATVVEEVRAELSAQGMADQRPRLEAPTATFASLAKDCVQAEVREQSGKETFGDLIRIVVSAVNESVHALYPMSLNATFAAELNQTWVEIVAQRSQLWNEIRRGVSVLSTVGDFVERAVRGMLQSLPFVAASDDLIADAAVPPAPVNASDMDAGLKALDDLLDDLSGVMVAIVEGNYTLASLQSTEDKRGLDDWQRGPVSAEDIRDAVEQAVVSVRSHPALVGSARLGAPPAGQLVVDGVVGIVQSAIGVLEAKVSYRDGRGPGQAPPRLGGTILYMLSSVETLMEGWAGFEVQRGRIEDAQVFGSPAAMKVSLDLAGCLKLGGDDAAVCDTIELPFSGERCVMREPPTANRGTGLGQKPGKVCMPPEGHQRGSLEEHLASVPDDGTRGRLAEGVSGLFDAAAVCATRTEFDCAADDMCNFTQDRTCELGPSFANHIVDDKNILGLVGKNNSCVEYLSRPKCALRSSAGDCDAEEGKCFWRQAEAAITGGRGRNATGGGGQGAREGSAGPFAASSQLGGGNQSADGQTNGTDGPGHCLDDWVHQALGVIVMDDAEALLESKHGECQTQADAERCRVVDASIVELEDVGTATIPSGGPSISKVVALSVSVGGTLLFVAVLAVVWKVVRGRSKRAEGKLKKSDKKCSDRKCGDKKSCGGKKGASRRRFRLQLPRFLRSLLGREGKGKGTKGGKCGKGCGKGGKKGKGEGKVADADIRGWGQPVMMPPAPFLTTSIMIPEAGEPSALPAKAKSLRDFSCVLTAIEPSGDSQQSEARVSSTEGRSRHLGPITSEIEPASETSGRSEDSECDSPWSGSEAWSEDESEVPVPQEDFNPLPESLYRHN